MSHESSAGVAPRKRVRGVWFVGLVALAWGLSGCLRTGFPAHGTTDGQGIDAGMDGGGVDGGGVDGGTGDAGSPDTPTACQTDQACDDGDPCTDDTCDPNSGQCLHALVPGCGVVCPSTAECQSDSGCSDGDACTKDLCVDCACEHVQRSGCGPTCDGILCDDGDPCTADGCLQGQCFFEPIPGCGVPPTASCSGKGVIATADAQWAPPGDLAKIGGTPQVGNIWGCTELACSPEAPCCNQCGGALRLTDAAGFGMEVNTMLDSEPSWSCDADNCGATLACAPPIVGTAYWAWGTLMPGQSYPLPNGVAAMPSNTLGVEGWCIQTNEAGLPGHYEGTLTLDDPAMGTSTSTQVTMDISWDASGWHLLIAPVDAATSGVPAQEAGDVVIGDGFVELSLQVTAMNGMVLSMPVHLDSWHNHLQGPVGTFGPLPPLPVPTPSGTADFHKTPASL